MEVQNSYKYPSSLDTSISVLKNTTSAIVPLQPQEEKVPNGWEQLAAQVQRVNQMAEELETAILELKAIASTLNGQRRHLHVTDQPFQNVCKYFAVGVPCVRQQSQTFILTTRKVDLFRAEREATMLAQTLRQKNNRKRSASQRQAKNKGSIVTNASRFLGTLLINKS